MLCLGDILTLKCAAPDHHLHITSVSYANVVPENRPSVCTHEQLMVREQFSVIHKIMHIE